MLNLSVFIVLGVFIVEKLGYGSILKLFFRYFYLKEISMKLFKVFVEKINVFVFNMFMEVFDICCMEIGDDYVVVMMLVDKWIY